MDEIEGDVLESGPDAGEIRFEGIGESSRHFRFRGCFERRIGASGFR
ncbi:MAG: hypothetical protein NTU83_07160 [Candidatus Hydrogenedentes bacterium]|nr:hypothetical protein [Candidatus Hydrogenedentota bacterium]